MGADAVAEFRFEAEVIHWRGPSPFFFVPAPPAEAEDLRRLMKVVTYGWGMIPVAATIGGVEFTTSLFPKESSYLLPLKDAVRRKVGVTAGDQVTVHLVVQPPRR